VGPRFFEKILKMQRKPKIIVVLGQTATGKSAVAVELAKKFNGEIISADSRQIYKGLDIATGKVTKKEMRGVSHHMLNVVSPKKSFSVAEWQEKTKKIISEIHSREKLPIICGGTGFYIQSIVKNVVLPEVPPNTKLRKKLESKTAVEIVKVLQKLDQKILKTIDRKNPTRLIRAIEIATELGAVPKIKTEKPEYEILQIGLKLPEKILRKNIRDRVLSRVKAGIFAEAKKLHAGGLSLLRFRSLGLEYRLLADFLQKKISRAEFAEQLEIADWHYARRQWQWFKRDKNIRWFSPTAGKKIERKVRNFLD
jgi:tRNA dimethylallyltransferase